MSQHPLSVPLRCKVAQEMRRRLAVLADLTQPSKERVDAMGGVIGSLEAARLAGQLQGERLACTRGAGLLNPSSTQDTWLVACAPEPCQLLLTCAPCCRRPCRYSPQAAGAGG